MFVNDALVSSHASTKGAQAKITFHYLIIKKSHIWILYLKLKAFREKFKSSNSSIGTTPATNCWGKHKETFQSFVPYDRSICCLLVSSLAFFFVPNVRSRNFSPICEICLYDNSWPSVQFRVNPLIYSLRMPMFRQSLRRFKLVKIRKQLQKYVVNWKGSLRKRYKELLT